jgi:hypothetical protein
MHQAILINFGGPFLTTSPLSADLWAVSVCLGFIALLGGTEK